MSTMHIPDDLEDRMIALGYLKRTQRLLFVNEAIKERLEREEKSK